MNNKDRLKEYVDNDLSYQDYKKGSVDLNDFDMFCVEHCKDIEELLNENEKLFKINQEHQKINGNLRKRLQLQEEIYRIKKDIDLEKSISVDCGNLSFLYYQLHELEKELNEDA